MRAILAKAVWVIALTAGLTAAGGWGYFIWSLDWGNPSPRGRALWLMLVVFPMSVIFPVVLLGVAFMLERLGELVFREKFPT
jgi:hypothetical protein